MRSVATLSFRRTYCRQCGYLLYGLREKRCPECGRAFDPRKLSRIDSHPWGWRLRRWARRATGWAALAAVLAAVPYAILWRPFHAEQTVLHEFYPDSVLLTDPDFRAVVQARQAARRRAHCWSVGGPVPITERVSFERVGPAWLNQTLGDRRGHLLDRCTSVYLGFDATDNQLERAAQLGRLKSLLVMGVGVRSVPGVTDAGMLHVAGMTELRRLSLRGVDVGDAGIAHLYPLLPNLEQLNLDQTRVTDVGLGHLKRAKLLRTLTMSQTRVSDGGIAALRGLLNLEELTLVGLPLTDVVMDDFEGLPKLRHLDVSFTDISEARVRQFKARRPDVGVREPRAEMTREQFVTFRARLRAEARGR